MKESDIGLQLLLDVGALGEHSPLTELDNCLAHNRIRNQIKAGTQIVLPEIQKVVELVQAQISAFF